MRQSFSIIVLTEHHSLSARGAIVGFFKAGSSASSFGRFVFFTFTNMWILLEPSTTASRLVALICRNVFDRQDCFLCIRLQCSSIQWRLGSSFLCSTSLP